MHQHVTITQYWRLAISDTSVGVNFRAGSVWIFQLRFDSVFNLKYSVSVSSVSVFPHHRSARVSYCENTKTESTYFNVNSSTLSVVG